jgi:hypothetical protein
VLAFGERPLDCFLEERWRSAERILLDSLGDVERDVALVSLVRPLLLHTSAAACRRSPAEGDRHALVWVVPAEGDLELLACHAGALPAHTESVWVAGDEVRVESVGESLAEAQARGVKVLNVLREQTEELSLRVGEFNHRLSGYIASLAKVHGFEVRRAAASSTATQRTHLERRQRQAPERLVVFVSVEQAFIKEANIMTGDSYVNYGDAAMGPHAQLWKQVEGSVDLAELAEQLSRLRQAMGAEAKTPEDKLAVSAIEAAEESARQKNGAKAIGYLKTAGTWALQMAEKLAVEVAAAMLRKALSGQ